VEKSKKETRREAIQKLAYATPIVLTLAAQPAFAQNGSSRPPRPSDPRVNRPRRNTGRPNGR